MTTLPGSSANTMNRLRTLAGGKGWLVEEAMIQDGSRSEPVTLPEVASYILYHRLREEELPREQQKDLKKKLGEWKNHLPPEKQKKYTVERAR